jgi:hypothetical protein
MNCCTPGHWASDLALPVTHYPHQGLTFVVLYGIFATIERGVLRRLQHIGEEAGHPMLLPGIVAELELKRHTRVVERGINYVEARIFELNFQSTNAKILTRSQIDIRNDLKRTSWLDLTYLRNSLSTWTAQLQKMAAIANSHDIDGSRPREMFPTTEGTSYTELYRDCENEQLSEYLNDFKSREAPVRSPIAPQLAGQGKHPDTPDSEKTCLGPGRVDTQEFDSKYQSKMFTTGNKIKPRLDPIIDNYDEKIRDCTMRVDGMAMATQWVNLSPFSKNTRLILPGA